MRGTANEVTTSTTTDRITPACAGNSRASPKYRIILKDHPRVCGEQHFLAHHQRQYLGSPPRVRGTATPAPPWGHIPRITPACAGNRIYPSSTRIAYQDHPRVCGEQYRPQLCGVDGVGSPPRVRGTAALVKNNTAVNRITPACAGNSHPYLMFQNLK